MILRLKSRLVSGLIASTIGMAGATLVCAADMSSTPGFSTDATTAGGASTGTSAAGATSTTTGTDEKASTNDTTMSPRGANPSTTTNATAGTSSAADSQAKQLFDRLDANHDGMLSLDEFSRATFQQPTK